jgi:hypothetical protein
VPTRARIVYVGAYDDASVIDGPWAYAHYRLLGEDNPRRRHFAGDFHVGGSSERHARSGADQDLTLVIDGEGLDAGPGERLAGEIG